MAKYEVVGLEPVDYENKDRRRVFGTRIYYTESAIPPSVGVITHDAFITNVPITDLKLGPAIAILFEPGRVAGMFRCTGVLYDDNKPVAK